MNDRLRLQALVTPWQLLAATAMTTLVLLVGFGTREAAAMTWRLHLAGIAMSASAAFFFDDPAAATIAPTPTPLLRRRWHRAFGLLTALTIWWIAASTLLRAGFGVRVPERLAVEVGATAAVAVALALLLTRSSNHAPGVVGAFVAPAWFALSYVPRPAWVALPPAPRTDTAVLLCLVLVAIVITVVASLDPWIRISRTVLRRGVR